MQWVRCGEAEDTAAAFSICTEEGKEAMVHFLWPDDKGAEIHTPFMCLIWGQCTTLMEHAQVDRHV
jgi:hypothetical protein